MEGATIVAGIAIIACFGAQVSGEYYEITAEGSSRQSTDPGWVWRCETGTNCVRQPGGVGHASQDECRLVCGTWGALWPKPTGGAFVYNPQLVTLDTSRVTFNSSESTPLLQKMQELFVTEINLVACGQTVCPPCSEHLQCKPLLVDLNIFDQSIQSLEWSTDESYSLEVSNYEPTVWATVVSMTIFGARHAMQTLSQMMVQGRGGGHALILSSAQVDNDKPKYVYRGLLVDTSRHFFPIAALERTIDTMSSVKLNTLHLHLTDSHSFPFKSEKYPEMAQWGAYSEQETYSMAEMEQLSQYALARGVRIIPELDAPAHAGNGWQWGPQAGLGELAVCINQQPWKNYCIQPPCGQLNPGNENVYKILGDIYGDMANAFRPHANTVFHMGGDEVVISCWRSSQAVTEWLSSQPGHEQLTDDDYHWAWSFFQNEALRYLDMVYNYTNPTVILWSSGLTQPDKIQENLDASRYVIQTWVPENQSLPQDLINLGYNVIVSNKDAWYLDWGFHGDGRSYSTWKRAYDAKMPPAALGGEVCLWTELIDDFTMDSLLWPRTAAAAERMWSNPDKTDTSNAAEARLLHWRRRVINTRGIQAASITPEWCELAEAECHRPNTKRVNGK
ncbi:hypothetical protein B566_EDAN000870 [Ephemera danica]|nr:hypothetical protein B566_EDAN000870 [Ephemera danica]